MMKRLYLGLLAVAAIAVLTTAASLALFTASAPTGAETATYSTGTVTLDNPTTRLASVTGIAPGDSGSSTYSITYSGSLSAWLGLDTSLSGTLTTCDPGKFTVTIRDANTNSYLPNTANQVVKGASAATAPVTNGTLKAFTVAYDLDLSAGNACQGASADISLTVHAVQSKNNTKADNTGPTLWN